MGASGRCLRGAAGARLRRLEGGRPDDQRHRRRALPARKRQPSRLRQHLHFAGEVPPGNGRCISRQRADEAADGRACVPPLSEEGHRLAHRGLPLAERRRHEPRPHQAGVLGCVQRDRPEDIRAGPASEARRGRLAGHGRSRRRRTSASRASCPRPRRAGRDLPALSSATSPATRRSKPWTSSASRTSRTSIAGRPGSFAPTAPTRSSYDSVKAEIAKTGGNCDGTMRPWAHSTKVDGATVIFPKKRRVWFRGRSWSFIASANEDALFDAGIYRVTRHKVSKAEKAENLRPARCIPVELRAFPSAAASPRKVRLLGHASEPRPIRGACSARRAASSSSSAPATAKPKTGPGTFQDTLEPGLATPETAVRCQDRTCSTGRR